MAGGAVIGHPQIVFGAFMFAVVALSGWGFWALPLWSRPGMFFSVTVVPNFRDSPEAARVLRGYRIEIVAHLAIAFALVMTGAVRREVVFLVFSVLWLVVGPLIAISRGHAKAMPYAVARSTIREASLAPRPTHLPGGWLLQLTSFAILLLTAAYLSAHWAQIPDRFPVHWGIDGQPNGWSVRTPMGVYGPLCFGAGLVAMISLLGYGISHAARRIPGMPGDEGTIDAGHRIALVLIGVELFLAAMFSLAGLLPLTGSPGAATILILAGGMIVCVVLLIRWQSQGLAAHAAMGHPGDGTPDECWKLGLFYFNPDDSALFVQKRIGIGYTINFAHASAWIVMALTLLVPLGALLLAVSQQR
jgi:uncharacterized membrane protein